MKRFRFGKRSLASGVAVLAALATAGGVAYADAQRQDRVRGLPASLVDVLPTSAIPQVSSSPAPCQRLTRGHGLSRARSCDQRIA